MKKKRVLIIAVVAAVVALIAAACIYGYLSGRKPEEEPKPPVTEPVAPNKPVEQPPSKPENPVQPENPNPSGGEPVVVYVPDEQGETLTPVGASAEDDSDQALVDALIASNSLPDGVEVQSSKTENGVLTLDMNAAYGDAVRSSGSTGENMLIYSLVNTFIQARGVDKILITVDGAPLESGHEIYDYPLEMSGN
ncbi:MAG: GerMN domain-containing protein [Eubacteriales bacterium]|nr:GerMN domain-containing protein [Eubacteriales bacterium]